MGGRRGGAIAEGPASLLTVQLLLASAPFTGQLKREAAASLQEAAALPLAWRGLTDRVWLVQDEDTAAAAEAIDPSDFSTLALH